MGRVGRRKGSGGNEVIKFNNNFFKFNFLIHIVYIFILPCTSSTELCFIINFVYNVCVHL